MSVQDKTDFTQGSIIRKMLPFMGPILGALILQAAYGAVDLLVVGRFGSTAGLSAVSTGSQVLNLVTFVITALAMGVTVLIARYIGEKNTDQIGELLGGATTIFAILAVVLAVVMVTFARPLSVLMQAPAEAVTLTSSYVRICGGGIFFIMAYNVLTAIFRGFGDSKSPLIFVFVACIVNVVGDLILVAGCHLDAAGAAIATVVAQAISVVLALALLKKKKLPFKIFRKRFQIKQTVQKIALSGTSAGDAGVPYTDVVPCSVCIYQQTGPGGIIRIWSCLQDRQLCHAGTKLAYAVHGFICIAECWSWKRGQSEKSDAYRYGHRTICRRGGIHWRVVLW